MTSSADQIHTPRPYHDVDISSFAFWGRPFEEREPSFAKLRQEPNVTWHPALESYHPHSEPGFWAAVRQEDIAYVSKHPELFSSAEGAGLGPIGREMQEPVAFFLMMDPPKHTLFRGLISSAFTPKQVRKIEMDIATNAKEIVDDLVGAGDVDFVERCAAILPMRTVADMIGVARSDRETVAKAAEAMFAGPTAEDIAGGLDPMEFMWAQINTLKSAAMDIAKDRRKNPRDDLMTNIVNAEIDGQSLTDEQIGAFMILLSTAGNDTTKQTTAITMHALSRHPDQKAWLQEDYAGRIGGAIEEFIRFASPVMTFARTATEDTYIGESLIKAGEKVGLLYCSANRDESVIDRPTEFDLSRTRNPHMGFGGGGPHYCLGNAVAKTQLRSIFGEILTRIPHIEVGEPDLLLPNSFVNGIRSLPVTIR